MNFHVPKPSSAKLSSLVPCLFQLFSEGQWPWTSHKVLIEDFVKTAGNDMCPFVQQLKLCHLSVAEHDWRRLKVQFTAVHKMRGRADLALFPRRFSPLF